MKVWSQDCLGQMKASLFLDTNILSYLVDDTYPSLTRMISDFKQTCVINLISSEFCQLEFVGIRKREHYLREVIEIARKDEKIVNCSSLLKNYNQFECREIDFSIVLPNIREKVNKDLEKIVTEYGIEFNCKIHTDLFVPIKEICLHSKISKEDSFVIISALNPMPSRYNNVCFVLTHDRDFNKWHNQAQEDLSIIYNNYHLPEPIMIHQSNAFGTDLDVANKYDYNNIRNNFMELFIEKNSKYYLGKTIVPYGVNLPFNIFALKAKTRNPILLKKYITIIGKNLDFSVTTPFPVSFYHRNNKVEDGTVFDENGENIISGLFEQNDIKIFTEHEYDELLSLIKQDGNYVFYHCDTFN